MTSGLRRGMASVLAALLACGAVAQACLPRPDNVLEAVRTLEAAGPKLMGCPQANTALMSYTCTVYPKLRPQEVVRLLATVHGGQAVPDGQRWVIQVGPDQRYTVSPSGSATLVTLQDHQTAYEALYAHLSKAVLRARAFSGKAVPTCAQLGVKDSAQFTFQKCTVSWPPERRMPATGPQFNQVTTPLMTFRLRRVGDPSLQAGAAYFFSELTVQARLADCVGNKAFTLDTFD